MKFKKYAALLLAALVLLQYGASFTVGAAEVAVRETIEGGVVGATYDRLVLQSGGRLYIDNVTLLERAGGTELYRADFNDRTALTADWSVSGDGDVVNDPRLAQTSPSRVLRGKKASILGDSISTYKGHSNNPDYNTTLGQNGSTYPNQKAAVGFMETWWMQVIRDCGMELLVNNSRSGDELNPNETPGKGLERCVQLHSDTGADAGEKPDIIFIYFGTNDAAHTGTGLFRSYYSRLMEKLTAAYPDAEIFYFTLLPRSQFTDSYNDVIRELVWDSDNEKFHLVDLYRDTGITQQNLALYTYDNLHPNATGMDAIADAVMEALKDYASNEIPSSRRVFRLEEGARAEHVLDKAQKGADLTFDVRYDRLGTGHSFSLNDDTEASVMLRLADAGNGTGKLQYYDGQWVDTGLSGLKGETWYTLRVVVKDAAAQVFVDDKKVCDVPVLALAQGQDCPAAQMSDVPADAWYHEAVDYALTNKLMNGFDANTFGPDATLTRAQMAQVLYNKEGQPNLSGFHGFTDVATGQWYSNAVTWATQNGVMGGYGDGKFGPDDAVTVEQITVILWNYSGNPAFSSNADSVGEHSGWAANALSWCAENGIFEGLAYDRVTDTASRAQTAHMLMNYLKQ